MLAEVSRKPEGCETVREFCVNKGLTTGPFLRALDVAREHDNVSVLAHILLGKPFLPRSLDLLDTLDSIDFAIDVGYDRVVLMAASLREHTLTKLLYGIGEYTPPSPRTLIAVLKQLDQEVRSRVIIATPRLPEPASASQCPVCSALLEQLIVIYQYTSDCNYLRLADRLSRSPQSRCPAFKRRSSRPRVLLNTLTHPSMGSQERTTYEPGDDKSDVDERSGRKGIMVEHACTVQAKQCRTVRAATRLMLRDWPQRVPSLRLASATGPREASGELAIATTKGGRDDA